jgi:hypothetical protein
MYVYQASSGQPKGGKMSQALQYADFTILGSHGIQYCEMGDRRDSDDANPAKQKEGQKMMGLTTSHLRLAVT